MIGNHNVSLEQRPYDVYIEGTTMSLYDE